MTVEMCLGFSHGSGRTITGIGCSSGGFTSNTSAVNKYFFGEKRLPVELHGKATQGH